MQRFLLAVILSGCGTSADPAPPPRHPVAQAEAALSAPGDPGRARVRFALAQHFERAELRQGGALFADLGTLGGAKYTGGGWSSQVGPDREIDGASAALTLDSRARFALSGGGAISMRVKSFRPGTLQVRIGDAEILTAELDGSWQIVQAPMPAGGEVALTVAFDRGQDVPEVGRAYLAVDWIRIGEEGPVPDERPRSEEENGIPTLTLPNGWSAGYALEVPVGARLRGVIEGEGSLEVWAHRDGQPPLRAGTVRSTGEPSRFDVDLGALAGDVARIDLSARGTVRMSHPAIVTLDRPMAVEQPARPHNVLVYLIDTLRADRLRVYQPDTRVGTPGISRFAELATVLTGARSQENWTKPSVATLLSGLMPWEHMAYNDANQLPASVRILPEMLESRGYATAAFVANGYVSEPFGFQRGWHSWRNYIRESLSSRGERVAADAIAWLDRRPTDRPFFLYVHAIDPHVPYRPPEEYLQMYDPEPYRGPVDFSRSATVLERVKTGTLRLSDRDRVHLEALYDGEVSYQDAQLASVMDALTSRGLMDDTIVIITADHGEEFFEHGSVGHGHSLHEELIHVPLIVRVPGLDARRTEGPVGLVDVVPTILDVLGEPIPDSLSGESLWPMMRGAGEGAPRSAVSGFMENWRSVVTGRYKLIARHRGQLALYDLANDPREQHDVASDHPITIAFLRGTLGLRMSEAGEGRPQRRRHRTMRANIDPELQSQLEALGYIGSSRPE